MCGVTEEIKQIGKREGLLEGRREIVRNFAAAGMSAEKISEMSKLDLAMVKQWLEEGTVAS